MFEKGGMMNNKRLLSFLIVGSLLLLPVSSYYAMSLGERLKEKAKQYMSEDTINILPGAVALVGLAAVGLYYYWTHNKSGDGSDIEVEENLIRSIVPLDYVWKKPTQLQVYCQFDSGGGSAASCGYHALLRSMQLIQGKSQHMTDKDLEKVLMDSKIIEKYFGQDGKWREEIIEKRKIEKFKNAWAGFFKSVIKENQLNRDDYELRIEKYKSALTWLKDDIIAKLENPEMKKEPYPFSLKDIELYIEEGLERSKRGSDIQQLLTDLQSRENINQYFDLQQMQENFFSKNDFIDLNELLQQVLNNLSFEGQKDLRGDWLTKEEIQYLWKHNKQNIISEEVLCGLSVIDDVGVIGLKVKVDVYDPNTTNKIIGHKMVEVDDTISTFREELKKNIRGEYFHVFALGDMRHARGNEELVMDEGHWYSLVMHQNEEDKREYYIMDSASRNNTNRRKDPAALKIIELLEQ